MKTTFQKTREEASVDLVKVDWWPLLVKYNIYHVIEKKNWSGISYSIED